MNPELTQLAVYAVPAALVALAGAFFLGRRTGAGAARLRDLQAQLEGQQKEHERALAELQAAREQLERTRAELGDYRGRVVDHFAGTSDLLRDLTVQYRAVYDHLTQGAGALCPEGFVGLEPGAAPELPSSTHEAPSAEAKADESGTGSAPAQPAESEAARPKSTSD